ncbi:MAG: hypothetical protein RLZZ103_1822, partial [Pseudomonadota bacterium]
KHGLTPESMVSGSIEHYAKHVTANRKRLLG